MPSPVSAEITRLFGCLICNVKRNSSSTWSVLLNTTKLGTLDAPISWRTLLTVWMCKSICGWLASTMWSRKLDSATSSSVALKDATSWCGSFLMNPTVSVTKTFWFFGNSTVRVVGSSVAKSLFSASRFADVRTLNKVDFPAFV